MKWYWEKRSDNEFTPPQISTIFQGWEEPKAGLFGESKVPVQTEVFVREVVQNFIDASREDFSPGVKPKLTFRFVELEGEAATWVTSQLGLQEIPAHYGQLSPESKANFRISEGKVLGGNLQKIRLLIATEFGTSGMYGQWERSSAVKDSNGRVIRNKMRDAMLSSVRDASAGKGLGSFGEGKKAVIAISATRTIFAYTCFKPESSADNVYSRFLGALYWENHHVDNTKYAGLALLGKELPGQTRPSPFVDTEADSYVNSLGLPGVESRKLADGLNTGTTLIFLEPLASPEHISEAIARNWWPLMLDGEAEFEVIDYSGKVIPIEFSSEIDPFVSAYKQHGSVEVENWESTENAAFLCETIKTSSFGDSARLSLAIDLRPGLGFSRNNPEKNWSLVALIRNGMIVKYQHVPKSQSDHAPFVRGVVEVNTIDHQRSEAALRKIEPPLHNNWPTDKEGVDAETVKHSREIWTQLKNHVEGFKKKYSTNIPDSDQDLPLFRELLGISGGGVTPPPPPPRIKSKVSLLNEVATLEEGSSPGTRFVQSTRKIALRRNLTPEIDELEVEVEIGWEIGEEDSWILATDQFQSEVLEVPAGFTRDGKKSNVFRGVLTTSEAVFTWQSSEYSELWTLRPFMKVTEYNAITGGEL